MKIDELSPNVRTTDPPTSRAQQVFTRFKKFHRDNPSVWVLFQRFADEMRKVRDHWSARAIIDRLRWELAMETESEDGLKLNNDFTPYYARMYRDSSPERAYFFLTRKRTTENTPAYDVDIEVFHTGPVGDEELWLSEALSELLKETDTQADWG